MTNSRQFPDLQGTSALPALPKKPVPGGPKHPMGKTPVQHPLAKGGSKKGC